METVDNKKQIELKEFEKFLKICRKYGVLEIDSNGIRAKFNEKEEIRANSEPGDIETDGLSTEELMFYSAQQPS